MSKLTLRAQTVDIAYLPLRQDLFAKNLLMTVQRDFRLGNSLSIYYYTILSLSNSLSVNGELSLKN
jgi:hypothetical protein